MKIHGCFNIEQLAKKLTASRKGTTYTISAPQGTPTKAQQCIVKVDYEGRTGKAYRLIAYPQSSTKPINLSLYKARIIPRLDRMESPQPQMSGVYIDSKGVLCFVLDNGSEEAKNLEAFLRTLVATVMFGAR